jgi:hypothetical protein
MTTSPRRPATKTTRECASRSNQSPAVPRSRTRPVRHPWLDLRAQRRKSPEPWRWVRRSCAHAARLCDGCRCAEREALLACSWLRFAGSRRGAGAIERPGRNPRRRTPGAGCGTGAKSRDTVAGLAILFGGDRPRCSSELRHLPPGESSGAAVPLGSSRVLAGGALEDEADDHWR